MALSASIRHRLGRRLQLAAMTLLEFHSSETRC